MEGWTTASLGLHFLDEPSKAFAHRVGTTINRDGISTTHGWPSSGSGRLSSASAFGTGPPRVQNITFTYSDRPLS